MARKKRRKLEFGVSDDPGPRVRDEIDLDVDAVSAQIGPAMAVLRKRAGLQQKEVSEMTGMSRSQISRYEKGDRDQKGKPCVPNMTSLLKYLVAVRSDIGELSDLMFEQRASRPEKLSIEDLLNNLNRYFNLVMRRFRSRQDDTDRLVRELQAQVDLLERTLDNALRLRKVDRWEAAILAVKKVQTMEDEGD